MLPLRDMPEPMANSVAHITTKSYADVPGLAATHLPINGIGNGKMPFPPNTLPLATSGRWESWPCPSSRRADPASHLGSIVKLTLVVGTGEAALRV